MQHLQHKPFVTDFETNSYVTIDYGDSPLNKPPSKLHTPRRGPYRVVNHTGSIYALQNLVTGDIRDYHVSRLQPYYYDADLGPTPDLIANKDDYMVKVEQILGMRGNPKGS